MAQVHHDYRRPRWWGPDWLRLPIAFWLSVLASGAATGLVTWMLLRHFFPSLYTPFEATPANPHPGPRFAGDFYAALGFTLGALPPLPLWKRALHRRGLHSWDD
jgi:hypothetical protein